MFLNKLTPSFHNRDMENNRDMEPGETLFQYLKRKKHIQLKKSLSNTLHNNDLNPKQQTHIKQIQIPPKSTEKIESARQASTKRRGKKSSNKKKKVDQNVQSRKQNHSELSNLCQDLFQDNKTTRRSLANTGEQTIFEQKFEPSVKKLPTRSFMSMISPLKNQANFSLSPHSRIPRLNQTQQTKSFKKVTEFNTKKMIKENMSKIEQYCNDQADFEKEMKEKLRQFFILTNSLIVQLQGQGEGFMTSGMEKKIKELKSSMKLMNGFFSKRESKQKEEIQELIEQMHRTINQVLDSFEGQVKSQSQNNYQSMIVKKQEEFQEKIEELTKQRNALNRQINCINKEYNKLEREFEKLLDKHNLLQEQKLQSNLKNQQSERQNLESFQQQIQNLIEQNVQLKNKISSLEKKLKDSEYKFEEYFRKVNIEHQQKLNQRQSYLLKQISLIKAECSKDIKNLNAYYTNRQELFPKKIKELENTISDQNNTIKKLSDTLQDTENLAKLQESNVKDSKRKVEQVMLDLYRINQELYKHWLALKDIKTLLSRLNMFDKFERIFKDISFDDVLFLP